MHLKIDAWKTSFAFWEVRNSLLVQGNVRLERPLKWTEASSVNYLVPSDLSVREVTGFSDIFY